MNVIMNRVLKIDPTRRGLSQDDVLSVLNLLIDANKAQQHY